MKISYNNEHKDSKNPTYYQREAIKEHVKAVVHFIDDIIVKGYVTNFNANRPSFHIYYDITDSSLNQPTQMEMKEIKAIFFVKTFEGDKEYAERNEFIEGDRLLGRRVEVTFIDGEVIRGSTIDYDPLHIGFFLIPVDPGSNNIQIFVVSNAVMKISFI
jgi:hypothetical protein